jgi:hypothetical protein
MPMKSRASKGGNMKAQRRRLLSLGIALVLVFSSLPSAALGVSAPSTPEVDASGVSTPSTPEDDLVYQSFSEDTAVVPNPERGWFRIAHTESISATTFSKFRQTDATTLVMLETNLKDFRTKPLSQAKLNEISSAFDAARKANLSVIFRAAYDFDGKKKPEPTNLNIITGHIDQLSGILHANEDILFSVQAGFLGSSMTT